jgi:hypothetical protein
MLSRIYNYKFLPFLLILTIFIATTHRYFKNIPGLGDVFQVLPYVMNAVIFFTLLALISVRKFPVNGISNIVFLMMLTLMVNLSYAILFFGVASSAFFIGNYFLPIFVYFYVILVFKNFELPDLYRFVDSILLLVFIITAGSFSLEFFLDNVLKIDMSFLYLYWDSVDNVGYHASAADSILFGNVRRPWGIMMLPQSTGGLLAVFSIFYLVEGKKILSSIAIVLSILSATGTALFVLVFGFLLLFILRFKFKSTIYFFLLIPLMTILFFFLWQMNDITYAEYFAGFFRGVFPDRLINLTVAQWLLGQILNYPVVGGGEMRFITGLFRLGLITSTIMLILIFYFMYKLFMYSDLIMKNNNIYKIYSYMIFIILCGVSSFHYDLIFRSPVNLLIMILMATITLIYRHQQVISLRKN